MNHKRTIAIFVFFLMVTCWKVSLARPLESLIPKKDIPAGWALIQGPQTYNKKTLFEHINGQAELFFKYGFQKSIFATYQNQKNLTNQIDIDIYDMGNVVQAFGIFSRLRNEDLPAEIGLDSYLDDRSAFFYKGKYFVMLYGPEPNPVILKQLAMEISLRILDSSLPPKEIRYFPKNGLKPGSIQYFSEGLLGYQFLKRGFQGIYVGKDEVKVEAKDKEIKLFLAIFKDAQEAMSTLKVYKDDLFKKGKVFSGSIIEFGTRALRGEDPYQGKVIALQKGFYLLGVVGFEKEENAENLLTEFIKNIK